MTPTVRTVLAVFIVVAAAVLGSASNGRAAHADNSICRPFTLGGHKIQWEVIGTWTCKAAKPWIVKLDKDRVKPAAASVRLHNGPARYHCFATVEAPNGRVTDGTCYLGTLAYPKSGFTW